MRRCVFFLMLMLCGALPVLADQRVELPADGGEGQPPFLERAFDAALAQEIQSVLGAQLAPSRMALLLDILSRDRDALILGYRKLRTRTAQIRSTPQILSALWTCVFTRQGCGAACATLASCSRPGRLCHTSLISPVWTRRAPSVWQRCRSCRA